MHFNNYCLVMLSNPTTSIVGLLIHGTDCMSRLPIWVLSCPYYIITYWLHIVHNHNYVRFQHTRRINMDQCFGVLNVKISWFLNVTLICKFCCSILKKSCIYYLVVREYTFFILSPFPFPVNILKTSFLKLI